MISGVVSRLWSMSLQADILILVVLAVRFFLKKYPKIYVYSLWILVGVRLLCPVFVETPLSLQPETIRPEGIVRSEGFFGERESDSGEQLSGNQTMPSGGALVLSLDKDAAPGSAGHTILPESSGQGNDSKNAGWFNAISDPERIFSLLVVIYLAGVGVCFCFYLVQYGITKYRVSTAVRGKENLWFSENVDSPFVLGIIRPRIIMPYGLKKQEGYQILKHEQTHIRHHDPLIRLVGTLCICLHWWNPLVWLAVSKMNQDMEMFCDEAVLQNASPEERKSYARTLLSFAEKRSGLSVGLAFGESHTERRVRNLMRKRKGGILVTVLVAVLAVFCVVAFMTIPGIEAEGADMGIGNNDTPTDGMGSNTKTISGIAGDFSLTEEEYLISLCPKIPEFSSEQDMDEDFWKEFLFSYYTSDFDRETVDRYVGELGFEVPYVRVDYDEAEQTVEQIFGQPLSAYVENPQTLVWNNAILYEKNSFYISVSDSLDYKYEYVSDTHIDILRQVELLEGLYDDEDYHSRIYLFLLPADNERGFIIDGKNKIPVPQDTGEGMIEGQSFDVEMNPHGQVTFAAYAPNTSLNPYEDVAFKLIRDGQVLYSFGGYSIRQDKDIWKFQDVAAVAFPDINGDGYTDVITIVNYKFNEGEITESTLSEARIYTGREDRYFIEESYLEEDYNNFHDQKTISDIQDFVTRPEYQDYFMRTSIYGMWKVTEHIPPTGIYGLSEEEIESFEGARLQYGMHWYKKNTEDPCTVDNYRKETITAEEFEESFRTNIESMGLSAASFDSFSLEGVSGATSLFGQFFYQIDADNALIYYEGVFFQAVRE